jgi:large conductance mechanosensitive channel
MLSDFKKFILRGNLIDLAAAVIIGTAFGAVVASLVKDVITPLIAAVGGQPSFDALTASVGDGVIRYGTFLNTLFNFLIVASVMFVILKTAEKLQARRETEVIDVEPAPTTEEVLLREIRDLLAKSRV